MDPPVPLGQCRFWLPVGSRLTSNNMIRLAMLYFLSGWWVSGHLLCDSLHTVDVHDVSQGVDIYVKYNIPTRFRQHPYPHCGNVNLHTFLPFPW